MTVEESKIILKSTGYNGVKPAKKLWAKARLSHGAKNSMSNLIHAAKTMQPKKMEAITRPLLLKLVAPMLEVASMARLGHAPTPTRLTLTPHIAHFYRYEDALNSVKAAMDEGIVPGGGSTLVYMLRYKQQILDAMESDDEKLAVDILFRAIQVRLWSRPKSVWSRPTSPLVPTPLTPPPLSRANPVPDQPDRLQRRRGGRARPRKGEGQGVRLRLERRQRRVRRPLRDGRDRPGDGDAAGDHQLVLDRGVGADDQLPDHRDSRGGAADDGRRRRRPDGRHAWHVDSDGGETYHPATSCLSPPFPPARRPHPLRAETRGLRPKLHSRA